MALLMWENARVWPDDPRRGDGGQPDLEPEPDRPSDPQLLDGADDGLGSVFGVVSLSERNPRVEKTRVFVM